MKKVHSSSFASMFVQLMNGERRFIPEIDFILGGIEEGREISSIRSVFC